MDLSIGGGNYTIFLAQNLGSIFDFGFKIISAGLYSWSCRIIHDSLVIQLYGRWVKWVSSRNSSCLKALGTRGIYFMTHQKVGSTDSLYTNVYQQMSEGLRKAWIWLWWAQTELGMAKMGSIWVFISLGDIKMWVKGLK